MPSNFAEKDEFRAMEKAMRRSSKETNFDEAVNNAFKCFKPIELPIGVMEIFENPKIKDKTVKTTFWLLSAALKNYYDFDKTLPLAGSLPDMTSTTELYLELQ